MANSVQRYSLWMLPLAVAVCLVLATTATEALGKEKILATQKGKASYYSQKFHGRRTASGKRFNNNHAVAAHPTWPFDTLVRVTNLANGKSLNVHVIDRGPSKRVRRKGIVIDVSRGAAKMLGFIRQGITPVRLEVLKWGPKRKRK